jgi:hypothetical protein
VYWFVSRGWYAVAVLFQHLPMSDVNTKHDAPLIMQGGACVLITPLVVVRIRMKLRGMRENILP